MVCTGRSFRRAAQSCSPRQTHYTRENTHIHTCTLIQSGGRSIITDGLRAGRLTRQLPRTHSGRIGQGCRPLSSAQQTNGQTVHSTQLVLSSAQPSSAQQTDGRTDGRTVHSTCTGVGSGCQGRRLAAGGWRLAGCGRVRSDGGDPSRPHHHVQRLVVHQHRVCRTHSTGEDTGQLGTSKSQSPNRLKVCFRYVREARETRGKPQLY